MNNKQLRWLLLIIISFIWGSSFILIKKALIDLTPIQVGALRIIFTTLTLLIVSFNKLMFITKKQWYYIFLTAISGTFIPVFLFAFAVQNIDSSIVSILNSLTPINTLIVGMMFFGLPFLRKQFIGIGIGLVGALFLILKGAEVNLNQNYFYALCIVLASGGYAFNINILKKYLNDMNVLALTTANFVIIFIPAVFILWSTDFIHIKIIQSSKESLFYLLILSIFGTAIAKTVFNRLVQISSPVFSSSVTYLIPFVAAFWGALDGEKLQISQIVTGSLILFGIYLTNKEKYIS